MKHWKTVGFFCLSVVLPLAGFWLLAADLPDNVRWDEPLLFAIHQTATPRLDIWAARITHLGGILGLGSVGSLIVGTLLIRQRWQSLLYVLVTLVGIGLLNRLTKMWFHRPRPHLWTTPQEVDFSFPSGHAMGSLALVVVLILLSRQQTWAWLVASLGGGFVLTIAWTRLYLGVHYPSDILAGWLLAFAWVMGMWWLLLRHTPLSFMPLLYPPKPFVSVPLSKGVLNKAAHPKLPTNVQK